MCIPVHSPCLPGYINVTQTVLIILTMVGVFPDRPCTFPMLQRNKILDLALICLMIFMEEKKTEGKWIHNFDIQINVCPSV